MASSIGQHPTWQPFDLERYFARHEHAIQHLLCASSPEALTVGELISLTQPRNHHGKSDAPQTLIQSLWDVPLGYPESQGGHHLRDVIAQTQYGSALSKDDISVFNGSAEGIYTLLHSLIQPGDHLIIQCPTYPSLYQIPEMLGAQVSRWEAHQDSGWIWDPQWVLDHWTEKTKGLILNTPNNPTGQSLPQETLDTLVAHSERSGTWIVCDEVYSGLGFSFKVKTTPMALLSPCGISIGSLSKAYGLPGLRLGWIASRDPNHHESIQSRKDYTTITNSILGETLGILALENRDAILSHHQKRLQENLNLAQGFMASHSDLFYWVPPQAGACGFVSRQPESLRSNALPTDWLSQLQETYGILLLPGHFYRITHEGFRFGFGKATLQKDLEALGAALKKLR